MFQDLTFYDFVSGALAVVVIGTVLSMWLLWREQDEIEDREDGE